MNAEQWQQIYQLFNSALEREAEERDAFLDAACRDNPSLRVAVENLIVADERAGGFLREPLPLGLAASFGGEAAEVSMAGERFGPYRIVRELGRGGMGAVYLAERADEQYEKQVAIKIVRRGMDNEELRRRFRHERQILAQLDHPNIARLLDGGVSEDGLPYFVMEYVEGVAINEYCRQRGLNTTERLELFLRVCDAVQYAHRNRVVHRDLKPGNILVAAEGAPKLLDFGIARLLQPGVDQAAATADGLRPMTPAYASPEQARGGEIAATSDVYSLGVTLYELLTGELPYQLTNASAEELARAIREQEPEKPSAVSKNPRGRLAGELDDIVLMALRKEPERRYASVEQLAEDIRRHLAGHPVIARGESPGYRARKFIRRHRAGVAAAALILLVLLGGIGAADIARTAQARSEMHSDDVRKLAATLIELREEIKNLAGSTGAQAIVVKRGLEYLDKLAREAGDDQSLQRQLAEAYDKFGDVQGNNSRYGELGDPAAALKSYRKALAIRQALALAKDDWQTRYDLMISHRKIGEALDAGYRTAEALASFRSALALAGQLSAVAPQNEQLPQDLVNLHRSVSLLLRRSGESAEALNHDRQAWAILGSLQAKSSIKGLESHILTGASRANLGAQLREAGDLAGALVYYRRMLELAEVKLAKNPGEAMTRRVLGEVQTNIGDLLVEMKRFDSARGHYRRALVVFAELSAQDPMSVGDRSYLSNSHRRIAQTLKEDGDRAGAIRHLRQAVAVDEALAARNPDYPAVQSYLAGDFKGIADFLVADGDVAGAIENYRKSLALHEAMVARDPSNHYIRLRLGAAHSGLAGALRRSGKVNEALEQYRRALELAGTVAAKDPANLRARQAMAGYQARIGECLAKLNDADGAMKH